VKNDAPLIDCCGQQNAAPRIGKEMRNLSAYAILPVICARSSAGSSNGFLIEEEVFARVFIALHSVGDAR